MLEQLGKYRIDGILGKGAMGVVYKGFDPHIERVVALKSIHKQLLEDHPEIDLIARFKNEAQAAGRLNHPNIVAVYEYGETEDNAFIAMEYVQSLPLSNLMQADKPADLASLVSWISQLLRALDYAHARGVVHRDIKPANLLIEKDGHLKITDFGIARIEASTLTQVGSVVGTPCYMSPEQFRGETADGRSDVYASGVLLYQLLTGVRPFNGSSHEIMYQVMQQTARPPSQLNPQLGTYFDGVIANAMAKQPEQRYASARLFMEALLQAYRLLRNPALSQQIDATAQAAQDDMTVLAMPMQTPFAVEQMPQALNQETGHFNATLLTDTPWKTEALPELETLLSSQIGPMAKLFLRKSAAQASSLEQLCEELLQHIPNEKGRADFLQSTQKLRRKFAASSSSLTGLSSPDLSRFARGTLVSSPNTQMAGTGMQNQSSVSTNGLNSRGLGSGQRTSIAAAPSLSPELIAQAEQRLTSYIGPIAKIVCKRSAAKTQSAHEFYRILADNLPNESERTKFLRECGL